MSVDAYLLLAVIAFTISAFVREWLPIDLVALTSLALLLALGLITPTEAVSGFSNEAVVTVMMIFILSDALVRSGLVNRIGHKLASLSSTSHWPGTLLLLTVAGVLSAFINNVAALTILMPVAIHLAKHFKMSPSKLLLPLSYATIFGGACTLVGTSTNLLISSLSTEFAFAPIGMFEMAGLGGLLFVIGMVYNVTFSMRLLPDRGDSSSLTSKYRMAEYLTELAVPEDSKLVGSTVIEENISRRFEVNVLEILRGGERILEDLRTLAIEASDTLIVRGNMEQILSFKEQYGLQLLTESKLDDSDLADRENTLVEMQVSPTSNLAGQTIMETDFRRRFGVFVLAISRTGGVFRKKVAHVPLQTWDTLLVFGPRPRLEALEEGDDFISLEEVESQLVLRRGWWIPLVVVTAVMAAATLGWMSILKASILGAVFLLVTRSLSMQQAYKAINWTVIFLVAAILPMGKAMVNTGLASTIGDGISQAGTSLGPWAVVALIYLGTTLLTEIMSNNSTAVLMVPVAIDAAAKLGLDSRTFLMTVAFAASASFLTPMGYKTNAMVYGPGGYRFLDYIRVGTPLKIVFWILATLLVPVFWPFQPLG